MHKIVKYIFIIAIFAGCSIYQISKPKEIPLSPSTPAKIDDDIKVLIEKQEKHRQAQESLSQIEEGFFKALMGEIWTLRVQEIKEQVAREFKEMREREKESRRRIREELLR